MWISKKKWQQLEKRIADLERAVQSQQIESSPEFVNTVIAEIKKFFWS